MCLRAMVDDFIENPYGSTEEEEEEESEESEEEEAAARSVLCCCDEDEDDEDDETDHRQGSLMGWKDAIKVRRIHRMW
jgi:hypothetical protein